MRRPVSLGVALGLTVLVLHGQNVIEDRATGPTVPAIPITEAQVLAFINRSFQTSTNRRSAEIERVARRLDRHVNEFMGGWPWMPFHHTLGISGYEACFNHPDEMFYALSLAAPVLSSNTSAGVKSFLAQRLAELPPYSVDGFDHRSGRAREAYDVPANLRLSGKGKARSAFGVYAFWAYVNATGDTGAARNHWSAIVQRIQPLLGAEYPFDITKRNYAHDEAEMLNGNLAALIATVRLARTNADSATEQKALHRARQLLELRVSLERVNAKILETTDSTTKHLHAGKLARFCSLTPEVGEAVRTLTDGCGAAHLKNFREARNAWSLAFGDRMIGGENYTNPLHFPRALFAGAVFIEQLPAEQIASFVDVPWCRGDFYFIEKCALALGAAH
ncbi:MAG TPA: hypothetical protein VGF13_22425 [Verrucomicrobiae bacterium]|jgi:hypothetical protein